jgi:hypothetical protein
MTAEREREAREACDEHLVGTAHHAQLLDAYAAAVAERASRDGYARAIGDAIRCVEGAKLSEWEETTQTIAGYEFVAFNNGVSVALTRLRAMEK